MRSARAVLARWSLAAAALAAAALLSACAATGGAAADPRGEMMALLERSAESWNRGDLKGHLAIYDESVTVKTKDGPRAGIAPIEASFGRAYFVDGKPKQQLRMERVAIRLLSPESALMTGRFVLHGGGLAEQSGWFTLVWLHTAAGWRVVHDHTS